MAHDISPDFLKRLSFPHYPVMHARLALYPFLRRSRAFFRKLHAQDRIDHASKAATVTPNFESSKPQYTKDHWAWIEHMLPEDFWKDMCAYWPSRIYFEPPRMVTKSYDVGFKWNRGDGAPAHIERFPELANLLSYLQSDEWSSRIQSYIESPKKITCNSFMVNVTYHGSSVIPHKDDPLPQNESPFINMIFCIDGTGGGDSGELSLSHDVHQNDIFFTPPTLKNACLIYDTQADFYHGFPPVARGKKRWVITASFSPEYSTENN